MTGPASIELQPQATTPVVARRRKLPGWRGEALRTTFWLVPCILVIVALLLFAITIAIDYAAYHHALRLPYWIRTGSADAGRQVLIAIAAAIITVIGVVFSITILALTLASQQFGPRMMRNFMRDLGNQLTLGIFVGTFVYSVLALGFINSTPNGDFVPHLLMEHDPSYPRMVNRAFDKVRQAGRGMPAVMIRLLDSLAHIVEYTGDASQRKTLLRQAEMVMRGAELDIDEPHDLADIRRRYDAVVATARRMERNGPVADAEGWD